MRRKKMEKKINWKNKDEVREWRRKYNQKPDVKKRKKEQRNLKKREYDEYRKRYREKYPERAKEQQKKSYKKWIKKNIGYQNEKNKNNPVYRKYQKKYHNIYEKGVGREKFLLRLKSYNHLRRKLISERVKCELCGSIKNLESHHKKYINELKYLMLLCRKCHKELHKKEIK